MFYKINRRIILSVLNKTKLISSSLKSQHKLVLYNKNAEKSKPIVIRFDDEEKELYQSDKFHSIRSNNSKIFFYAEPYVFVFYINPDKKAVVDERIDNEIPVIRFSDVLRLFVTTKDSDDKPTLQPGGRIGRLDAASEAGFFHRTDVSRLKEIKKKLKDEKKEEADETEPKKTD